MGLTGYGMILVHLNKYCPALLEQPGQWSQPNVEVTTCPVYHAMTYPVKNAGYVASGNPSIVSKNLGSGTNISASIVACQQRSGATRLKSGTVVHGRNVASARFGNRLTNSRQVIHPVAARITTAMIAWLKNRAVIGSTMLAGGTKGIRAAIIAIVKPAWPLSISIAKIIWSKYVSLTASGTNDGISRILKNAPFTVMQDEPGSVTRLVAIAHLNGTRYASNTITRAFVAVGASRKSALRWITSSRCQKAEAITSATYSRCVYSAI